MSITLAPSLHWVTCELDAHGEIDEHAALCLRLAIEDARPTVTRLLLVDLRDLQTINAAGLALFRKHTVSCCARGRDLGLLICSHNRHDQIAAAFVLAGLGDQLHYNHEPHRPAPARPVRLLDRAHSVRRRRLARAARRCSPRHPRSAPTS